MRGRRGRYDGVDCGAAAEGKRGAAAADLHFCEGILRRIKISAGREGRKRHLCFSIDSTEESAA